LKGREKKDFEPVTFSEVDYQRMKRMNFFLLSRPCSTSKKKKIPMPPRANQLAAALKKQTTEERERESTFTALRRNRNGKKTNVFLPCLFT
jgi:hypothetical protein